MSKGMRYGPRFNSGSIAGTKGAGLGKCVTITGRWGLIRKNMSPEAIKKTTVKGGQINSLKHRKKMGIEPSLPHFSFEGPPPEPPPKPIEPDWLDIARRTFLPNICTAHTVIMVTDTHVLVAMKHQGRDFNACLSRRSCKISWTEGPAPYVAKNGPMKRKDG